MIGYPMIDNNVVLHLKSVGYFCRSGFFLQKKIVLQTVDLKIIKGKIVSLVGPNGSGKTTTLKLSAGLIKPDMGEVFLFGNQAHLPETRARIGLVTETQYAYPFLKLKEWLTLHCGLSGFRGKLLIDAVDRSLESMELSDLSENFMKSLSKGQLQRAGIAQAIAHSPDFLILDEPMSGLDPYWRYKVNELIQGYKKKGGTVFFSSHILSDVENLSDQVILMHNGQIRWNGSLGDLDRSTRGYDVVGKIYDMGAMRSLILGGSLSEYPGGYSAFSIDVERKHDLMDLVGRGSFSIESLVPIQDEIDKVLFRL